MANASARPITIQFVMIRPTNTESERLSSGARAFRISSTMITSDAMIVICTMIRMLLGISLRIIEMAALEHPVTNVTAMLITTAVSSFTVTAKALHRPRICNAIGLLSMSGSTRTSFGVCSAMFDLLCF